MEDEKLLEFATPKQDEKIRAYWSEGSYKKAAKKLGMDQRSIRDAHVAVKKKAAKAGYCPEADMTKVAAPGFAVKGTSSLYDSEGNLKIQWVKTDREKEEILEQLRAAVDAIIEPCAGKYKPKKKPKANNDDLLANYIIADAHLGLYSWADETGYDYDADTAKRILLGCMSELVDSTPRTKTATIINLADFIHSDNKENKTMRSGHTLDVDTRHARVVQIATWCLIEMMILSLKKHETVIYKSGIGNHDDHFSLYLAMMLQLYFKNEPRVKIDLPINPFQYLSFGKNLVGICHGSLLKNTDMPLIMATDKPKEWAESIHRVFWYGHIHHKMVKEHRGCTTESFRGIAAPDSYTHEHGYRSERDMECIILRRSGGEHGRRIVKVINNDEVVS